MGGKVTRQAVSLVSWTADGVISNHFQGENLVEVAKFAKKSWVSKLREKIEKKGLEIVSQDLIGKNQIVIY